MCAGSPLCTCLSVGMNVVMHSACAQTSVHMSVCLHALVRVHPFACEWVCVYVCVGYMPAYMCVFFNTPDFSYIQLLTSKCNVCLFIVHAVAHACVCARRHQCVYLSVHTDV